MAIQQATEKVWEKAALGRRDLDGLKGTVDWTIPRKILNRLESTAPGDTGALRNILAGGTWPQSRLAEVEEGTDLTCPSCGLNDEDEYHR
eukprot:11739280-Heterocapsa_arctica.AAC.1